MRRALLVPLLAASTVSSAAAKPAMPPILYVRSLACPAHRSCTGKPAYFDRIRRIARVGFPSSPV